MNSDLGPFHALVSSRGERSSRMAMALGAAVLIGVGALVLMRATNSEPILPGQANDIRLAVFRYHIEPDRKGADGRFFVFVRTGDGDPPLEMIRALSSAALPVKPGSDAVMRHGAICDRRTGTPGVLYEAGAIRLVNGNKLVNGSEVDVDGGGQSAGLSRAYGIYRLVRRNGRWTVLRFTMTRGL